MKNDHNVLECIRVECNRINREAQQAYFDKHGEPGYCGFAWVECEVTRTNSKEAKRLRHLGFTPSWVPKRMDLWIRQKVGTYGQSMDLKEAGARAVAEYLRTEGFDTSWNSRAD